MQSAGRNNDSAYDELVAVNRVFCTVRYSPDGDILEANNRFLRLIGYKFEDIVGQNFSMFVSKAHARTAHAGLWATLKTGAGRDDVSLYTTAQGDEVWLESQFVPIQGPSGDVNEVVQIARDVTDDLADRFNAQSQLAAIDRSQAVAHYALDGALTFVNSLFAEAMGYDAKNLEGRDHAATLSPDDGTKQDRETFWRYLVEGGNFSGEVRRIRADGAEVWLQTVYSPILDAAGRTTRIVQHATDITEEKLRQADYESQITAIRKSNAVVTYDMHGTILSANQSFLDATGYRSDDIIGRHHRLFVESGYAHGAEYARFWNDLRKGQYRGGQYKRLAANGEEVWLQATYNPIFDASGKPIKVVEYASPVTEERLVQAEHQCQIAAINEAQCVVSFDLDGVIIDANDNFLAATGYRFADIRGQRHSLLVSEEEAQSDAYKAFWRDLAKGRNQSGEYKRIGRDGREIWLQATYNPIMDLNGRPIKIIKYAEDITEEKLRRADYLAQIEAVYDTHCVLAFSMDGRILDANDRMLSTLGYEREDVIGAHQAFLLERAYAASPEYIELWEKLRAGEACSGMFKRLGKDGRELWLQASYAPIPDLNGVPAKVIEYATDVTSNVHFAEAFEEAKRQAHHDSATSLPNRTKLANFMDAYLAGPAGDLTVIYVDLDQFKQINDAHGHHVGDRVLGEIADRLRRTLRDDQMVARIGGDEFVIAAPGLPEQGIERLCAQLYEAVNQPIRHDNGEAKISMSLGIALAPQDGETPDELLRAADAALHRAKEDGRGGYRLYGDELNETVQKQRELVKDMRHSLASGDFYLEFQPRFNAKERTIKSAEALVRWAHPDHGRISPADFIPLAEQNGLIVPLGDWVMQTACETAAQWGGVGVSVNVSPIQFRAPDFIQKIERCLETSGLAPELLEIEITETVLVENATDKVAILGDIKNLNVKLSMDDFGTGYSSLGYLRNLPFDAIKIDRSFINCLPSEESARPIIQAIVGMAGALGMSVTAEGVETDEQLSILAEDDCDEVQGFLLAKPLSVAAIEERLEADRAMAA